MARKAFENPLLGHARMRAMYRALLETRWLAEQLGASALPHGLEACWVGTAIDLRPGDLTSDRRGGALIEHIRAAGLRAGTGALTGQSLRRTLDFPADVFAGSEAERMLCAVGAAMATRAAAQNGAVLAFTDSAALSGKEWKRLLQIAAEGNLPLVLVAVPATEASGRRRGLSALARTVTGPSIPVIPVDAADAVALYRVAQESLLRARAEGGTMIIDCVSSAADPIDLLGAQLVKKGICTPRWLEQTQLKTRATIAAQQAAAPTQASRKRRRYNH